MTTLNDADHQVNDRWRLLAVADGIGRLPSVGAIRRAMSELDVTVACVDEDDQRGRRQLRRAVRQTLVPVGDMRCYGVTPRS